MHFLLLQLLAFTLAAQSRFSVSSELEYTDGLARRDSSAYESRWATTKATSLSNFGNVHFVTACGRLNVNSKSAVAPLRFTSVTRSCGRLKNRLLVTNEGHRFCARNRDSLELIQGEFFSYLIAQLLGIDNVPQVCLMKVTSNSSVWSPVWEELSTVGWKHDAVVSITRWVEHLRPVVAPKDIRRLAENQENKRTRVETMESAEEWSNMTQWSDLIAFDYITGNIDRLVSSMYSLQWDNEALERPVNNLLIKPNGRLSFLDNEFGFAHSYRLLAHYEQFHEKLLGTTCRFSSRTKSRTELLASVTRREFNEIVTAMWKSSGKLVRDLSDEQKVTLRERLIRVNQRMKECERGKLLRI